MSSTTIQFLKHPLGVIDTKELRNSHGSAPVIWDQMAQTYLNLPPFHYSFHIDKLWPLWKDLSIPEHLRAVLGMTYDNTIIEKQDFARAVADIKKFLEDFPVNHKYENHWPEIQKVFESNHWTSVTENPFEGDWNEEEDKYEPLNWKKYWSMYHKFDNFKGKE